MQRLPEKIALVTGASQGIGRAIAQAFGREGARVVVTARSTDALQSLVAEIEDAGSRALAVSADLRTEDAVTQITEAARAHFGRIDILVNNAAIIHPHINLVDFDAALWREVMDVNLNSAAMLTKAVLPSMIDQRSGKIINISSIGGRRGGKGRSAYRVTKAALISLTESVAAEVKEYGIDVNCICPGGVDTEGFRAAFNSQGRDENPRLMLPDEIAELAVFLCSDASSAVTGASIDAFGRTNPLFS